MKVKNRYKSKSDFINMSDSERVALSFVKPFYYNEMEDIESIKETSMPMHTLFNCVYTITEKLKNEEMPELFIDEIWNNVKHERGSPKSENPLENLNGLDYDYRANYWYEGTLIFDCVYVVMALDCPDNQYCLKMIKKK